MDRSTPGFPVLHHLLELAQTQVHSVGDATQPSHSGRVKREGSSKHSDSDHVTSEVAW